MILNINLKVMFQIILYKHYKYKDTGNLSYFKAVKIPSVLPFCYCVVLWVTMIYYSLLWFIMVCLWFPMIYYGFLWSYWLLWLTMAYCFFFILLTIAYYGLIWFCLWFTMVYCSFLVIFQGQLHRALKL